MNAWTDGGSVCSTVSVNHFIHLVQRNVLDWGSIDLQDPVANMNRVLDVWTDALFIDPEHTDKTTEIHEAQHRSQRIQTDSRNTHVISNGNTPLDRLLLIIFSLDTDTLYFPSFKWCFCKPLKF